MGASVVGCSGEAEGLEHHALNPTFISSYLSSTLGLLRRLSL